MGVIGVAEAGDDERRDFFRLYFVSLATLAAKAIHAMRNHKWP